MTKKITGITHLRDDLLEVYSKVRQNKINADDALLTTKVAGKIINSAKTQLEYNAYTKSKRKIPFLES